MTMLDRDCFEHKILYQGQSMPRPVTRSIVNTNQNPIEQPPLSTASVRGSDMELHATQQVEVEKIVKPPNPQLEKKEERRFILLSEGRRRTLAGGPRRPTQFPPPLIEAVRNNDTDTVKKLLEEGHDPLVKDEFGRYATKQPLTIPEIKQMVNKAWCQAKLAQHEKWFGKSEGEGQSGSSTAQPEKNQSGSSGASFPVTHDEGPPAKKPFAEELGAPDRVTQTQEIAQSVRVDYEKGISAKFDPLIDKLISIGLGERPPGKGKYDISIQQKIEMNKVRLRFKKLCQEYKINHTNSEVSKAIFPEETTLRLTKMFKPSEFDATRVYASDVRAVKVYLLKRGPL